MTKKKVSLTITCIFRNNRTNFFIYLTTNVVRIGYCNNVLRSDNACHYLLQVAGSINAPPHVNIIYQCARFTRVYSV